MIAGQAANKHGVPVLLDPVGAGATPYRTISAQRILQEVDVSLIRGNAAEIAHLIGEDHTIKGVDAGDTKLGDERRALAGSRREKAEYGCCGDWVGRCHY